MLDHHVAEGQVDAMNCLSRRCPALVGAGAVVQGRHAPQGADWWFMARAIRGERSYLEIPRKIVFGLVAVVAVDQSWHR